MKKKIVFILLFILCYLLFTGIILYPYISQYINSWTQSTVINEYTSIQREDDKRKKILEDAHQYNQSLLNGLSMSEKEAFSPEQKLEERYLSLLDIGADGMIGYIEIPSIDLSIPLYHGTTEKVLQKGAGHLYGTSLPVGGKGTHSCISAHRGLPQKVMFTNLDMLKEGDLFYIYILDEVFAYEVYDTETVLPDNVSSLKIHPNKDLVTLITCTPYGINTHRLYVHAKRVPYEKKGTVSTSGPTVTEKNWWVLYGWKPIAAVLLLVLVIMVIKLIERKDF